MATRLRIGIHAKILVVVFLVVLLSMTIFTVINVQRQRSRIAAEALRQASVFTEMSAPLVFSISEWNIGRYIKPELQEQGRQQLDEIMGKNQDIAAIRRVNKIGEVYFTYDGRQLAYPERQRIDQDLLEEVLRSTFHETTSVDEQGEPFYDVYYAIFESSTTTEEQPEPKLSAIINMQYDYQLRIDQETKAIVRTNILLLLLFLAISALIAALLAGTITRPLIRLRDRTAQIANGNYDVQVAAQSNDELGDLAASFDRMAAMLKQSMQQLEDYNKNLELQVKDRTVQLDRKIKDLEETKRSLEEAKTLVEELNKNLEEKVSERTDELQKANVEIQQLLETRTRFINQVAHDLRTPLTPIKLLLPQVKTRIGDHLDDELKKQLGMIEDNLQYLSKLVDDTLSIARLDAGSTELSVKKLDLAALIDDVVKNQQAVFDEQGVKVAVEMDRPLPVPIDELRIKEVLSNLISNSLKFMHMEEKRIDIHAARGEGKVVVSFADNGDGVEQQYLEEIFQEFNKIDQSRHTHSSGLGLAICRRIIEKHGGKIWAESEGLGKGLTVKFTLPLPKN